MKKKIIFLVLLISFLWLISGVSGESEFINHLDKTIKSAYIFTLVETFSSPQCEGRLSGTAGYDKAVQISIDQFKKFGIQPIYENKTFTQSFPITYTKVYESKLVVHVKNKEGIEEVLQCEYFKDYYPLNFSGSGKLSGNIVFAGYGVTAPEFDYDDYKGIDVKNKIVMIIKGVPKEKEDEDWSAYDEHRFRTKNALKHGASGLLYIYAGRGNPNGDYLPDFPMLSIEEKIADKIFEKYGKNVKTLTGQLNQRQNVSFVTDVNAEIMVKSENFQGTGVNVIGYIPGADELLRNEFIVIGAHLDHCGMWPQLTPGADDNASGSAALLSIAGALSSSKYKPKRSVLFILFAGEEMGLLGSKYFVSHLPGKVKKINFVFNMDMIGAGPNVFIARLKNYPEVEKILVETPRKLNLCCQVKGNEAGKKSRGGADHAPFVEKGIPAVSIFSTDGQHHGYHTNDDTIYWITPKIIEDIAKIVSYTTMRLASD
ncbi:MAG: M20/M25/M40 family metallo-hydrolase [Acidobacteria bacterium]|jgi:hypothetical protein|nr:M20/M25/M40 family metallo-hydrolase [Acidobacteriota bacterium]